VTCDIFKARMHCTPLFELHRDLGAKMVNFAGWEMPLQYVTGINQEHLAVRTHTGLFDVSHMGQLRILGKRSTEFLRFATLNDPGFLKLGRGQYSMIPNHRGGLIDDIYVYRDTEEGYMVVSNAANTEQVRHQLKDQAIAFECHVFDETSGWSLLALQGPASAVLLDRLLEDDLTRLRKNTFIEVTLSGCPARLARTGYTGEDGFEIFCRPADAPIIWALLTEAGAVPCGLGARDTLRLEAGFPLFGQELTAETNPLCSNYAWVVKDKPFFGRAAMWAPKCHKRLTGLKLHQRGVARHGYRIFHEDREIGLVTSGTISPLTRESIALGWIDENHAKDGDVVGVEIRGQSLSATITTPPFF
jgi:aminomethyltransferase